MFISFLKEESGQAALDWLLFIAELMIFGFILLTFGFVNSEFQDITAVGGLIPIQQSTRGFVDRSFNILLPIVAVFSGGLYLFVRQAQRDTPNFR